MQDDEAVSPILRPASRIPRLNRSLSLNKRPASQLHQHHVQHHDCDTYHEPTLTRSASFISSRGMNGLLSPSPRQSPLPLPSQPSPLPLHHSLPYSLPLSFPLTPEVPRRRRFSYVSPYSRGFISAQRKAKESSRQDSPDDCDSIVSFDSMQSGMSESPHGRLSGVVHCSRHNHEGQTQAYLTPTQRAARTIRALRGRLAAAEREIAAKDAEITTLNRQLVQLRLSGEGLREAAVNTEGATETNCGDNIIKPCHSPDSEPELRQLCSDTGGSLTTGGQQSPASVSLAETNSDSADLTRSLADSGHYDLTSPATSARDHYEGPSSPSKKKAPTAVESGVVLEEEAGLSETDEEEEQQQEAEYQSNYAEDDEDEEDWRSSVEAAVELRLRSEHDKVLERVKHENLNELHEIKQRHNDKVETLLTKLSDANLRYFELRPQLDRYQARVQHLEAELERAKEDLSESERRHQSTYLQMFLKGQQAARLQHESESVSSSKDGMTADHGSEERESTVAGLMRQLALTQDELRKLKAQKQQTEIVKVDQEAARNMIDPAVTLQFLKSAVYYFLTDKDNAKGHLRAIISILGFNEAEKYTIVQVVKI